MKLLARACATICVLIVSMPLCGCQLAAPNPSGNFQVTETSVGPSGRELETIRLNNCDGKADTTQIVERGQTVQIEGGAQLGVSIEVIQAAVTGKYSKGFSYKKSQMLTAPPGTNMEFTLEWTMEERVGTVARDGQTAAKAGYRYIIPTYVQIRSQKDLGCAGSSQPTLPAPSASKVTPPTSAPKATPLPTPTPLADTPPGTILEVGQTWRQRGLELTLVSTKLDLGSYAGVQSQGMHVCLRLANRRESDLPLSYTSDNFAAYDNLNRRLKIYACMFSCGEWSEAKWIIRSGESNNFGLLGGDCPAVKFNISDPSITEVIFTVSGISSISNARWRLPVSH